MNGAEVYRKHCIAEPRWGWSGAAEVILPRDREQELISAARLLPNPKSSPESLVTELLELGARYIRYLHQDEFGPTRAQRTAALQQLLEQVSALLRQLKVLPAHLRFHLSSQLTVNDEFGRLIDKPNGLDIFDIMKPRYIELLYEAAGDVKLFLSAQATEDVKRMEFFEKVAKRTFALLDNIDTSTSSDLILNAVSQPSQVPSSPARSADPLDLLGAEAIQLSRCLSQTLSRLKGCRGPDPRLSVPALVWPLCHLWRRETGQDVTSSAVRAGHYTSAPQSAAGRFVSAAVKALHPPPAWLQEHEYRDLPVRARIIIKPERGLARAIHLALRDYVALNPSPSRRGRQKGQRATS
jgi:hypothetical protein